MTLAGLEEALQERGIETFDISEIVDQNTRKKIEQERRTASEFFILYKEKDGVFEHYAVTLGEDVKKAIQEKAFDQVQNCKNFGDVDRLTRGASYDLMLSPKNIVHWLENPANQEDIEYLKGLVLNIEEALPYNPINLLAQQYDLKLKPVVTREEKSNGMVPAGLVVTYHLAE